MTLRKDDSPMAIRIGINGYGNLGRGVELAVKEEIDPEDLEALVEQSRSMLRIVPFDTSDQEEEHDDFF